MIVPEGLAIRVVRSGDYAVSFAQGETAQVSPEIVCRPDLDDAFEKIRECG
jgi:hypothetical protein